jgi:hypothetical protein
VVRLILAFMPSLFLAAAAAAQVEFRPAGGGFRIEFFAPPQVTREQVSTRFGNTVGVTARLDRADGTQFYAQFIDYPPAAAREGAQRLFDSLRLGRTVKGDLRSEQRFQFEGHPAQRQKVELHIGTRPAIVALDVLRGLRLYSVFCIVDGGKQEADEIGRFIDSFALLPL